MNRAVSLLVASALLAACAKSADSVQPQYVSASRYNSLECTDLEDELLGMQSRVAALSGQQDDAAARDSVAVALGVIIFLPALLVLAQGDDADELGRLKGEYEAVLQTAAEKDCDFASEILVARDQSAEARAAAQASGADRSSDPTRREPQVARSQGLQATPEREGPSVDEGLLAVRGASRGVPDNVTLPEGSIGEMTWEERRKIAAYNRANRQGATLATD